MLWRTANITPYTYTYNLFWGEGRFVKIQEKRQIKGETIEGNQINLDILSGKAQQSSLHIP